MLRDWWISMRTIIVLLCLAPVVAVVINGGVGDSTTAWSYLLTMMAFAIGFPIDWWRLQKRKARRG